MFRSLSTCSSFTNGSSSGTEYFSALSDDEETVTAVQQNYRYRYLTVQIRKFVQFRLIENSQNVTTWIGGRGWVEKIIASC